MTCAVPTCIDGIWNGMETDVDCGGATTCPRCADLRRCTAPSDCMTAACTRGRCGTRGGCHWALISQETQLGDTTITGLLTANGHTFDLYNSNTTGTHTSNATLIAMYQTIIFQKHDRVISATEQTVLQNFVNGGGRLLVTGYDSLGSPTDTLLASLLNCTGPADGPFSNVLSVVSATHPIMMGPAATFTVGMALTASSTDHDSCTPGGAAIRLVSVSGTSSKLQVTDNVGVGHGRVVYWNGNGSGSGALTDWTGAGGTQPALQNLFVNVLNHLCSP